MQSPEGHGKRYRQSGVWVQTSTIKGESTINVSGLLCWPGSGGGPIANTRATMDSTVAFLSGIPENQATRLLTLGRQHSNERELSGGAGEGSAYGDVGSLICDMVRKANEG